MQEGLLHSGQHLVSETISLLNSLKYGNNFSCCGAGTAADMHQTTLYTSANMELIRRNTNRKLVPVRAAAQFAKQYLYAYQAKISSYLIFGGVDNDGSHIYSVWAHGSSDRLPFQSLGSGAFAAMSIFESRWKPGMTQAECMKLVRDAVASGIHNDLGSGSNVDLVVITKNSHKKIHGYEIAAEKGVRRCDYTFIRGTTGVLSYKTFDIEVVEKEVSRHEKMEV